MNLARRLSETLIVVNRNSPASERCPPPTGVCKKLLLRKVLYLAPVWMGRDPVTPSAGIRRAGDRRPIRADTAEISLADGRGARFGWVATVSGCSLPPIP